MAFLISWFSNALYIVCPPQYKMYGKSWFLKMLYFMIYMYILKDAQVAKSNYGAYGNN